MPMAELCPICAEDIEFYAYGACNHPICHVCFVRMRGLYKQQACSICKTELTDAVIMRSHESYQSIDTKERPKDELLSLYCEDNEILEQVLMLLRFTCPDKSCDKVMNSWSQLINHAKDRHGKQLCKICLQHKKVFAHEHVLYTRKTLEQHYRGEDEDPSFKGHPECKYCSEHFYSVDEQFTHCREKHEECHLCRRAGIRDQYYKDYKMLEKHFRQDHFLCEDPQCLEKSFVVFDSEIDFKAHLAQEHGGQMSKSQRKQNQRVKVDFSFNVETPNDRPSARFTETAAESRSQDSNSNTRRGINAPPGFGGKLTVGGNKGKSTVDETILQEASSSNRSASPPGLSQQEEWPTIPGTQSAVTFPPLKVETVFFKEMVERRLLEGIQATSAEEKEMARYFAQAIKDDPRKWKQFCSHCTNYLSGFILPEKLIDQVETLVGTQAIQQVFKRFARLFPENRADALLRVINDKRVRSQQFPELSTVNAFASAPAETSSSNALSMKQKRKNDKKPSQMDQISSEEPFPERKGKGKKKQLLMSTALPASSASPSFQQQQQSQTQQKAWGEVPTASVKEPEPLERKMEKSKPASTYSTALSEVSGPSNPSALAAFTAEDFPALPKKQRKAPVWQPKNVPDNAWMKQTESLSLDELPSDTEGRKGKKNKKKVVLKFG